MLVPDSLICCGYRSLHAGLALALLALAAPAAQAQDVYFSQPLANRQALNPAFAGLLDDYSGTLSFRNQFPTLAGTFQTTQLAGEWRLPQPGLHHALGLLVSQDRTGGAGYTRFEASGQYAYHTRLTREVALSGGASVGYGRQRVGYDNFVFGDQLLADGSVAGPSAEILSAFPPVNYLTLGVGAVLYAEEAWLSVSGQHLNKPDLGFAGQSTLPLRLNVSGGYKFFVQRPTVGRGTNDVSEISFAPVASYTRQGGSQRSEAGLYFKAQPVTLGAVYRNLEFSNKTGTQHILAAIIGVEFGDLRLGYSYDVGLSQLAQDLGGAHEITFTLRAFDKAESAYRRLRRRNYPLAPCPAF
ncbi:MAG: type IX secretion system membrane protein PorP/SprF [Hymenobacter sp.]|nr:MAG: type IX secretion system membrane protein PorP/SprF [Hymenobacter sp.]